MILLFCSWNENTVNFFVVESQSWEINWNVLKIMLSFKHTYEWKEKYLFALKRDTLLSILSAFNRLGEKDPSLWHKRLFSANSYKVFENYPGCLELAFGTVELFVFYFDRDCMVLTKDSIVRIQLLYKRLIWLKMMMMFL